MIDITHKDVMESNSIEIDGIEFVKVVRCKDCKWFEEFCDERKKQVDADGRCNKIGLRRDADWFCADGERRDPCSSQDS